MPDWTLLDSGKYNDAYVNAERTLVLKIQKYTDDLAEYDTPIRSVRLWNLLNENILLNGKPLPPAELITVPGLGDGWICPFISGDQATDQEMKDGLIDIFNRTGRIVIDAISQNNFVKTPTGEIVCIDIGMAVQMEISDERRLAGIRRNSITSLNIWRKHQGIYEEFFNTWQAQFPHSIDTIKALMFIHSNRPDISDVNFLKDSTSLVYKLAKAYDKQGIKSALEDLHRAVPTAVRAEVKEALVELKEERPINLDNIKNSCILQLTRYIASRGKVNIFGEFEPSIMTKVFRNKELTTKKIKASRSFIDQITDANSFDEIKLIIEDAQKNDELTACSCYTTSGLASCLGKCMLILATARQQPANDLPLRLQPSAT